MLGIGPEWIHLKQNGKATNSIAGEVAGDFMFWPTGKHRCRAALKTENVGNGVGLLHLNRTRAQAPCT
jgi:hypothetical protein